MPSLRTLSKEGSVTLTDNILQGHPKDGATEKYPKPNTTLLTRPVRAERPEGSKGDFL